MIVAPATEDPAAQRLLVAAGEEFRRFGFARARLNAIAAAAGMSHANVYRHFQSKADLADAITSAWLKGLEGAIGDLATAPDPADDKISRMVLTLARAYRARLEAEPQLFALFVEAASGDRAVVRRHRGRLREWFTRIAEEGETEGLFPARARVRAPTVIFDGCHRFLEPRSIVADAAMARAVYDARLEALVRTVLRGLTAAGRGR
jgi:AcrR family transcriptional regulator